MIKIVADKDLPFLDKAFDRSEEIELLKLPYDQITNSNLKNQRNHLKLTFNYNLSSNNIYPMLVFRSMTSG